MLVCELRCLLKVWLVPAVFVGLAGITGAAAQELDDFEQRGLRTGTFNIFTSLDLALGYNDNVLAAPDDSAVSGDFLTVISPNVRVESNTRRHLLFLNLEADSGRYFDLDDQNYDDFAAEVGGRWDITRTVSLGADLRYDDDHESSDDPDRRAEQLVGTTEIDRYRGDVFLRKEWRRGFVRLGTGFRRTEYDDVGADVFATPADLGSLTPSGRVNLNDGRDVSSFPTNLRIGYRAGRTYDLFMNLSYRATRYDRNDLRVVRAGSSGEPLALACSALLASGGPAELAPGDPLNPLPRAATRDDCSRVTGSSTSSRNRDFDTYRVLFGTDVDIERLVSGEFSAGFEYRTFEDPGTDAGLGFSFAADLDWILSPRTTLNVNGEQGFRPTSDGGTVGTDLGSSVVYALSRRAQVGANVLYERDDREETDRLDQTVTAGLFTSYSFNRYLTVGANYTYRQRFSNVATREFDQNRFFLTVRGRY